MMLLGKAKRSSWLSETESLVVRLLRLTTSKESVSVYGAASPCRAKTKGASFLMSGKLFLSCRNGICACCILLPLGAGYPATQPSIFMTASQDSPSFLQRIALGSSGPALSKISPSLASQRQLPSPDAHRNTLEQISKYSQIYLLSHCCSVSILCGY